MPYISYFLKYNILFRDELIQVYMVISRPIIPWEDRFTFLKLQLLATIRFENTTQGAADHALRWFIHTVET